MSLISQYLKSEGGIGYLSLCWIGILGMADMLPSQIRTPPEPESVAIPIGLTEESLDTVPVVVHVIHTGTPIGAPDNPPDSLIHALLAQINAAFQKDGPFYGGADIQFRFQLATRSPSCESTNGINRVDGSGVPYYAVGGITFDTVYYPHSAFEIPVKALSKWPNTDYLNLWIVNKIDSNDYAPGGYAYFPEYNSALVDGMVLRASVVNGTNKTAIHELGHYFSLYHTFGFAWEDCEVESDCTIDGDEICDTENCMYTLECTEEINPCTEEAWIVVDTAFDYTVLHNHMGYTDCAWMFTEDQKTRMRDALYAFRPGLLSSGALLTGSEEIPVVACIPTADNDLSMYYGIERVEFHDLEVYSNTSLGDAAFYVDRTCNQRTRVAAGDSVFIRITPSYGDGNPLQIKVFLDLDGQGDFDEPDELILSSDFSGIITDTVLIPLSGVVLCTPLRLRVVTDVPGAPEPTACHLVGTPELGVGQIEDYAVIITPRSVESVSSGDWDDPLVWSCNCIPGETDAIRIKSGHTIVIPQELGTITCADMQLDPGAICTVAGNLTVSGVCN